MRRSVLVRSLPLVGLTLACADSPTAPVAAVPLAGVPRASLVASDPGGAAALTLSAPDATDCGGVADVTLTVRGSSAAKPLDVVVLMDASASVGSANWTVIKQQVLALIDRFTWSAAGNHMAIVQFAGTAVTRHPFASPQTNTALRGTAGAILYMGGTSAMRAAVQRAIEQFDARGRPGATKVVFLITNGSPSPIGSQDPCTLAGELTRRGVQTRIFGVGSGWSSSAVRCLASDPSAHIVEPAGLSTMGNVLTSMVERAPSVKDIVISAWVPADFAIDGTPSAPVGTLALDGSKLTWTIPELGDASQTLSLRLRHAGSAAASGAVSLLTDAMLTYTAGATVTERLGALPIQVASCDVTPPAIVAGITGVMGSAGWYTSDVALRWNVSDPESPFSITAGCVDGTVTADTRGESFSCTARSAGGSATVTEIIRRDATAPAIGFTTHAASYGITASIDIRCSASDATSGIASVTCPEVHAPAWTLGAGVHTLSASATDNAGNSSRASISFAVAVTHAALCDLTRAWVQDRRIATRLCAWLEHARRKGGSSHANAADEAAMRNYIRTVEMLTDRQISAEHRAALLGFARQLAAETTLPGKTPTDRQAGARH